MPGPWVQGSLDPGWIASQVYLPGSMVEFFAYVEGAKAQGRVLATVEGTRRGVRGEPGWTSAYAAWKCRACCIGLAGDLGALGKEVFCFISAMVRIQWQASGKRKGVRAAH